VEIDENTSEQVKAFVWQWYTWINLPKNRNLKSK